jgi:hypothetical protein
MTARVAQEPFPAGALTYPLKAVGTQARSQN